MCSVLFKLGPLTFYGYGLCLAVGMILAVGLACKRSTKYGLNQDYMFNTVLLGLILGLIAAKLTYYIVEIKAVIENPRMLLDLTGGLVVYGGLIVGLLVPYFYLVKKKKTSYIAYIDIAVTSIPLGQAFGRLGCFCAGCCHGKPAPEGAWYGVVFPAETVPHMAGVPLIPTQLISAAGDLLLFFFLLWFTNREKFRGQCIPLYMILYSIGRFLVEFLRGDRRGNVGALSTSQFIAIFTFTAGIVLYFVFKKMNKPPMRAGQGPIVEEAMKTGDKVPEAAETEAAAEARTEAESVKPDTASDGEHTEENA